MRGNSDMKISESEIKWLNLNFPNLNYDEKSKKIMGELDFCAAYDNDTRKIMIGNLADGTEFLIQDVFEVEICLEDIDMNGWPKVFEIGKRYCKIAQKNNIDIIDLHINPGDNSCCLGIKHPDNRTFRIQALFYERVIPFFYRLSYVEKFGIEAVKHDSWKEYSHDDEGIKEYLADILNFAKSNPNRNDLCPCKSGKKYKKCHLDDVESLNRSLNELCPCGSRKKYKECHFDEELFLKLYLKESNT